MAQCKLTLRFEQRWIIRQGFAGLLVAYFSLKAGLPFSWFFKVRVV